MTPPCYPERESRTSMNEKPNDAFERDVEVQTALGWDVNHPEAFCDTCGRRNIAWYTGSRFWNEAVAVMPFGRGHILCPECFVAAWETATGVPSVWELVPTSSTLSRIVAGAAAAVGAGSDKETP